MDLKPPSQKARVFNQRRRNPDYCHIDISKEVKAELLERAKSLNLSMMGLIKYMLDNTVITAAVPQALRDKYPSSSTAYRKTWKLLCDFVEKNVVSNPGSTAEWHHANSANYSTKQVDAALDQLCHQGRVTRTVAGFFPVNIEVP